MTALLRRLLLPLLASALFAVAPAQAQSTGELGDALSSIGEQYARNYTRPVTDALGADLNAGLFRTAEFGETGLLPPIDLYVGVSVMGAFTAGSPDAFRLANDQIRTSSGRTLIVEYPDKPLPTAFGRTQSPGTATLIDEETGTQVGEVTLPGAIVNTPIAPLVMPQVGIGTVLGTDAQIRFLPETKISDYGSVSLVGLSVRHSISQYIPLFPVNLAVQGTWQSLSLSGTEDSQNPGKIVDASGWALNAQVSKDIPVLPLTLYGGVQYESFGVDVEYTFLTGQSSAPSPARTGSPRLLAAPSETATISYHQEAANSVRALAGVSLSIAIFKINVDYALSANNTVSAGVGVVL